MTIIVILGMITCGCAVAMAILSASRLHIAERGGHCARPFVLPVFVGVAYFVLNALVMWDALSSGRPRLMVQAASQVIQTMLIISVILLIMCPRRSG